MGFHVGRAILREVCDVDLLDIKPVEQWTAKVIKTHQSGHRQHGDEQ